MRRSANEQAVDMYKQALRTIEINTAQKQMLIGHAQAAGMKLSVTKIGEAGGYEGSSTGRLHYGRMARKIAEAVGSPVAEGSDQISAIASWTSDKDDRGHGQWILKDDVANALRELGWISNEVSISSVIPTSNASLDSLIHGLSPSHKAALLWFQQHQGQDVPWPKPMPDGTFLVNKAKGIHKPVGLKYALSVRQSLNGPYADRDPVIHRDGSWTYQYFQEKPDPAKRDTMFTNVALLECQKDGIPIGVLRQVKAKPAPRYRVMGLALVREWQDGYFRLEGFTPAGMLNGSHAEWSGSSATVPQEENFNPHDVEDARRWITASIVRRQGQGKFRADVLAAYENHCAISACDVPEALEAAHIFGYLGTKTNVVTNGLLLRGDLHTLYDLGLIAVDPMSMKVLICPRLVETNYGCLAGTAVRLPKKLEHHPNLNALKMHADWSRSTWK